MKNMSIQNAKKGQKIQFKGRTGISSYGYSNGGRYNLGETYVIESIFPDTNLIKIEGKVFIAYKSDFKLAEL